MPPPSLDPENKNKNPKIISANSVTVRVIKHEKYPRWQTVLGWISVSNGTENKSIYKQANDTVENECRTLTFVLQMNENDLIILAIHFHQKKSRNSISCDDGEKENSTNFSAKLIYFFFCVFEI